MTDLDTLHALRHRSKTIQERSGTGLGTLLDDSWALLACPGRPKMSSRLALWRPGPVPSTSQSVSSLALTPQNRPTSIFPRSVVDLGSMFVNFRSNFQRFVNFDDERSTIKTQKKTRKITRSPCVWPVELACTTFTIHPTPCKPTLYTFSQAIPT